MLYQIVETYPIFGNLHKTGGKKVIKKFKYLWQAIFYLNWNQFFWEPCVHITTKWTIEKLSIRPLIYHTDILCEFEQKFDNCFSRTPSRDDLLVFRANELLKTSLLTIRLQNFFKKS